MSSFNADAQQCPLASADSTRKRVSGTYDRADRDQNAQFFTPAQVARILGSYLDPPSNRSTVRLLDPGAGVGTLTAAYVSSLAASLKSNTSINATLYEIDDRLIPELVQTMQDCVAFSERHGFQFKFDIRNEDFVDSAVRSLHGDLLEERLEESYDRIIMNPPFRKISSSSATRLKLNKAGIQTSNLYAAFVACGAKLLNSNGQLVAIIPRSFCNGSYFREFRRLLLNELDIDIIHTFRSRSRAFKEDSILQETVIIRGHKERLPQRFVDIVVSDDADEAPSIYRTKRENVVDPCDSQQFIRIIENAQQEKLAKTYNELPCTLQSLGILVSTGPVVDFRLRDYIAMKPDTEHPFPLLYPVHFENGGIVWPKANSRKPNAIKDPGRSGILVQNSRYVLVKRFTSKEESKRIVAVVYEPNTNTGDFVGIENHLNYFYCDSSELSQELAAGLATFLNSTFVDQYFRQFSGHTQVNANDLRCLKYPSKQTLTDLGHRNIKNNLSISEVDRIVANLVFTDA